MGKGRSGSGLWNQEKKPAAGVYLKRELKYVTFDFGAFLFQKLLIGKLTLGH